MELCRSMVAHICSSHGNRLVGFPCLLPRVLTKEREDPVLDAFQQPGTVFRDPDIKLHGMELPCRLVCQKHLGSQRGRREERGREGKKDGGKK